MGILVWCSKRIPHSLPTKSRFSKSSFAVKVLVVDITDHTCHFLMLHISHSSNWIYQNDVGKEKVLISGFFHHLCLQKRCPIARATSTCHGCRGWGFSRGPCQGDSRRRREKSLQSPSWSFQCHWRVPVSFAAQIFAGNGRMRNIFDLIP